ncbi:hypothetical protein [Nostocoides sp. HKS02]|uniref:hypothetical protein n=1 Tax=Nostocoides sp. HKS02 TaxID=1813880 RepID=UPI0012B4D6E7|nr:hypothetical protein [Tetrasphaera sp. HKS02]QGN59047.1 hypothetical protein GKE56_15440 [Tetrasphaera sp. HKS02]
MGDLTPCAVVVDSRNARGQSRKAFGWPRHITIEGIRSALNLYGLDPVSIDVGVATRSIDNRPSVKVAHLLASNARYAEQLRSGGANVLEGYLVERRSKGKPEEKQIDVLCAVQVCRLADAILSEQSTAKCIVIMSEDMDLMPAYEFALERKVPAYAVAFDTVHKRDQQREWILLSEEALRLIHEPLGRQVGSGLRTRLATIATSSEPRQLRWTVHAPPDDAGQFLMRTSLGAPGLWTPGRSVEVGAKIDLYAKGLRIYPTDGGRFPHLILSEDAPSGPMPEVQTAEVLYWQGPTAAKVRTLAGEEASLRVLPGTLLPGQRVAVLRHATGPDPATYLVGPLEGRPAIAGWSSQDTIARVKLIADAQGAWYPGEVLGTTDRVMVHAAFLDHARIDTELMAFVCGVHDGASQPAVMPITCCLPAW